MTNAKHSKVSREWYTTSEYVEAARELMGGIDCDPASCKQAQMTVRADEYYTKESNGLVGKAWRGRIFLNPPGGLVREFWQELISQWRAGGVTQAIWIGYSLEQLQTLQRYSYHPLLFPMCVPRKRIAFDSPGQEKRSPTHANYICYLPRLDVPDSFDVRRFHDLFGSFGATNHG